MLVICKVLLVVDVCVMFIACCVFLGVRCVLWVACFGGRWLSVVGCWLSIVVRCLLSIVDCFVIRLFVVYRRFVLKC